MGIKEAKNRMKKAQERFLEKSEDVCEACITRMKLKAKADGVAYCLDILEQECPEELLEIIDKKIKERKNNGN